MRKISLEAEQSYRQNGTADCNAELIRLLSLIVGCENHSVLSPYTAMRCEVPRLNTSFPVYLPTLASLIFLLISMIAGYDPGGTGLAESLL